MVDCTKPATPGDLHQNGHGRLCTAPFPGTPIWRQTQSPFRPYPELVEQYQRILATGGKAKGRNIPKHFKATANKEELINHWRQFTTIYLQALRKNWKDAQLDHYLVEHPLLGKITLRELCYFTIYHTDHHLEIVQRRIH
nr:DinB family protein [Paraflavitalea speifideiaquila]